MNDKNNTVKTEKPVIENAVEIKTETTKILSTMNDNSEKKIGIVPLKNTEGKIIYERGTSALYVLNIFKTYLTETGKDGKAVLDSRFERGELSESLKKRSIPLIRKINGLETLTPEEKAFKASGNALGRIDRILSDIAYKVRLGLSI
jgi:hypothetical protein